MDKSKYFEYPTRNIAVQPLRNTVFAIIIILASMLLPAFTQARAKVRDASYNADRLVASLFCALFVALLGSPTLLAQEAPFAIRVPDHRVYQFNAKDPLVFTADASGSVRVEPDFVKSPGGSLCWTWDKPGAAIIFTDTDAFRHLTGESPDPIVYKWVTFTSLSAFGLWVYNPEPIADRLVFEIGDGKTVTCRFWMDLNFGGWREVEALYGRDIQPLGGFPDQKSATTLRIIAPASVPKGTLYFDDFAPRRERDVRAARRTEQLPWVRPLDGEPSTEPSATEIAWGDRLDLARLPAITPEQAAAVQRIRQEWMTWERPMAGTVTAEQLAQFKAKHAAHSFARLNGRISGAYNNLVQFYGELSNLGAAYYQAANRPDVQAEIRPLILDYVDLLIAQGHGSGYGIRTVFARPICLLMPLLEEEGRALPLLEKLGRGVGMIQWYDPLAIAGADVYNTQLSAMVSIALLHPDDRQVHQDLLALRHWLERTARYGEIQPDGSFFHHQQTYVGYNVPAMTPWCQVLYLLRSTEYLPPTSHLYARRTLAAMHAYANQGWQPHTLSGRWRNNSRLGWGFAQNFWRLAELGNPESGEAIDTEMAAIYLHYADLFDQKENEQVKAYARLGIKPISTDLTLALNYTVALIHRRADWMMFFRGQRNPFLYTDLYGFQGGNTMGRYLNYGHMAIISAGEPVNPVDSGWAPGAAAGDLRGFNPNFWPGTTSRELPMAALRSHFSVEEPTTEESFAVGTHLGGSGIFGMKLREDLPGSQSPQGIGPVAYWLGEAEFQRRIVDAMYDADFRTRKSVFAFDERIVCLGSDITSSDPNHRVVTTLLQHHLTPEKRESFQCSVFSVQNGSVASSEQTTTSMFPLNKRLEDATPTWLIDSNGNGYYVPEGQAPLEISRNMRKLPYHTHWNDTQPELMEKVDPNEGETELALLDHGGAPQGASYEYCIVMRSNPGQMANAAARGLDYKVLRQDKDAHIVYDKKSKITGYVFFEPLTVKNSLGVDKACVVMTQPTGAQTMKLSICDAELGEIVSTDETPLAEPRAETQITLTLPKTWRLATPNTQVESINATNDGRTAITVRFHHLLPVELELVSDLGNQDDFEEEEVPERWQVANGEIAVSDRHYKTGCQSLRWRWPEGGSRLIVDLDGLHHGGQLATTFWLYREQSNKVSMFIDLLNGEDVIGSTWVNLNFYGWRPIHLSYEKLGQTGQRITALRFRSPEGAGMVQIDTVVLNQPDGNFSGSYQQPEGWPGAADGPAYFAAEDISLNRPWLKPLVPVDQLDAAVLADAQRLAEANLPNLRRIESGTKEADMINLRQEFADLEIVEQDGVVTGRPVASQSQVNSLARSISINTFMDLYGRVATAYAPATAEQKAELGAMFVLMTRHWLDQGWQEGSPMGWHGNGYDVRSWPGIFPKMRDVLGEAGLMTDAATAVTWHFAAGNSICAEQPWASMDLLNNYAYRALPVILTLPDPALRVQRLHSLSRFYSKVLQNPGTLGPDGLCYHHGMYHYAYGSYSMPGAYRRISELSGTAFQVSQDGLNAAATYLRAHATMAQEGWMAPNQNGRAGTPMSNDMSDLIAILAQHPLIAGDDAIQKEMKALYLALKMNAEDDPLVQTWRAEGIAPHIWRDSLPLNGAAALIHRRPEFLASIFGMSKWWRGVEVYGWTESNNYSRFSRLGSMIISMPGEPKERKGGWQMDGWDWNCWPGTTSLSLPQQELFAGYTFYGNNSSTAGATALDEDGVWGMDYSRGSDVNFRKTAFCFDNRITVLSTGIRRNNKQEFPVISTLAQAVLAEDSPPVIVDGSTLDGELALNQQQTHWFIDQRGIGYLVQPGQGTLNLRSGEQSWTYMFRRYLKDPANNPTIDIKYRVFREEPLENNAVYYTPTTGRFFKAWVDHGDSPEGDSLVYTMVLGASPETMTAAMATTPLQLLQQDNLAHVALDTASKTIAAVIYDATAELPESAHLRSASRPCFLMLRDQADGSRRLSIAITDRDTEALQVVIRGAWRATDHRAEIAKGETTLSITRQDPQNYMPILIALQPAENNQLKDTDR